MGRIKFIVSDFNQKYLKPVSFEAASLSFYTIFTIIPAFMIIFSVFTNSPFFQGYYLSVQKFIYNSLLPGKTEIITKYIETLVANSSKLGFKGFIYGFIAAIIFFMNFEYIMNKIFEVEKGRDLWNKISTFWTLIGLVPMCLLLSFYFSFKLSSYVSMINLTKFLPFLLTWFIFVLVYAVTPNRKINRKAVFVTSFCMSAIWSFMRWFFISYIIHNKIYFTIYGSFSIILLLFIWIYISWIIVIGGAYFCKFLEELFGGSDDYNSCN